MDNNREMIFSNDTEKTILSEVGLKQFNDFFLFNPSDSKLTNEDKRVHKNKKTGDISRSTIRIEINNKNYFLKRTVRQSYYCIQNEYKALEYIVKFNLIPANIVVRGFDDIKREGFILFKELDDFISLYDIFNNKVSKEVKIEFKEKKTEIFNKLEKIFINFQNSQFFYRDWMDKHIFINLKNLSINLIDLERFIHKNKLPLKCRIFPFLQKRLRKKEQKKFQIIRDAFINI